MHMIFKQSICIAGAVLIGIGTLGCSQEDTRTDKPRPELPVVSVSVGKVSRETAAKQAEVVGTVQAVDQAQISSKIAGNIISLPVDLGSRINRGDLLVELAAGEITAQVQQAKAQLEQARRNLSREEALLKKNAATRETVKSLMDSEKIASAAFREAQTMLDYTRITAPFTGIVTRKIANVGDLATPGRVLLHIETENNLQVLTDLPEKMMLKVQPGEVLSVFIPSVNLTLQGRVTEISPTADPTTRTVPIKLRLPPDPRLRSGQFARVTLALEQAETFTIASTALTHAGQMEKVFVADGNKAQLRLVRSGAKRGDRIEILSGLSGDETVIVESQSNLLDGQAIAIR